MPEKQDYDTTYYRYYRTLDGSLLPLDLVKQTGRLVPRFVPESRLELECRGIAEILRFYREIMYNLTRVERRTWLPLLQGHAPEEVALSQGVSRQAIIARIRGNRGRGGMIRKNDYVAIWWRLKKKINQYE